jgi:hypothetical protein
MAEDGYERSDWAGGEIAAGAPLDPSERDDEAEVAPHCEPRPVPIGSPLSRDEYRRLKDAARDAELPPKESAQQDPASNDQR